ncbi:MAG: hypothetical protein ISR84_06490, partial [Kiritimatiellales bacterium]|nr:hypothetical protein [Kiritimatiellales bacterium]
FHPHPAQKVDPGCTQEELIAGLEYLLFSDVRKKVPTLGRSVLLLHGLEDLIIPAAASEWLCDHLPEAQLALFENAGHALPTETILPVIHEFLS